MSHLPLVIRRARIYCSFTVELEICIMCMFWIFFSFLNKFLEFETKKKDLIANSSAPAVFPAEFTSHTFMIRISLVIKDI